MNEIRVGRYLIYGLLDPRSSVLRYIGKTHLRRKNRLKAHVEAATEGSSAPVHAWIRELHTAGVEPLVFVLERIASEADWRVAERAAIARWEAIGPEDFPYVHPPQTPKSQTVEIKGVELLNVQGRKLLE